MQAHATLTDAHTILPLRARYRQEMNCQIVHDSIHSREGWTPARRSDTRTEQPVQDPCSLTRIGNGTVPSSTTVNT
jgi:hypothetical protein